MKKRTASISDSSGPQKLTAASPEAKASSMPLIEDLARREKTPFVMTSFGRRAKNVFGWESGRTMYFSPDEPS